MVEALFRHTWKPIGIQRGKMLEQCPCGVVRVPGANDEQACEWALSPELRRLTNYPLRERKE
jgi:hypothetical protein